MGAPATVTPGIRLAAEVLVDLDVAAPPATARQVAVQAVRARRMTGADR